MSVSQAGGLPGTQQKGNDPKMALMKLNSLMFQSFIRLGESGLTAVNAAQTGDQMAQEKSAREMMIASKQLNDVKKAMSMMAQPQEAPLAGGRTGVQEPRGRQVDAQTGQPIGGQPGM